MQKEFTEYLKYFTLSAVILIFSLAFNHLFTDIKRLYIDTHFGAVISDIVYIIFILIGRLGGLRKSYEVFGGLRRS